MEKPKVFFVAAANCIHTIRWVNALSDKYEIHLIYCSGHGVESNKPNNNVVLHELKYKAPLGYYLNYLELRKLYKEIKPELINVHYASGYATLTRLSKIKPALLSVWGSDVYDFPNESKIKKKILQKNVLYMDEVASTSYAMEKELRKQVPSLKKEIHITPFGVDINKFKKVELKKDNNTFNIGNVKTLESIYGIEYAILAVKDLKDRLIDNGEQEIGKAIKFYIYGDGEERDNLQKLINEKGLEDSIFLMGRIPNTEVPKVLNNLDVFCITSLKESFGVAIVEAMSCEVPIVATDAEGFCEVMEDNVTGYVVERKNIRDISLALEKMLRDKELRIKFGKNGRQRVLHNYDWNQNVELMEKIYDRMIRKEK